MSKRQIQRNKPQRGTRFQNEAVYRTVYDTNIGLNSLQNDFNFFRIKIVSRKKILFTKVDIKRAKEDVKKGIPEREKAWKKRGILPYPVVISFKGEDSFRLVDGHHRLVKQKGDRVKVIYGELK